jgi:hypothetical protein
MELTTEQRRIINQVRKHVSGVLASELQEFFRRGKTFEDLRDIIEIAANERRAAR